MLTIKQAAARLGLSETFIKARIADASLRAYKFGTVWRIAVADLDQYVAGCVWQSANRNPSPAESAAVVRSVGLKPGNAGGPCSEREASIRAREARLKAGSKARGR